MLTFFVPYCIVSVSVDKATDSATVMCILSRNVIRRKSIDKEEDMDEDYT